MVRRFLASLAIVVTLIGAQGPAFAVGESSPDASPEQVADGMRFRAELGFDARQEIVRSMLLGKVTTDLGLPLTDAEQRELVRRGDLRERLQGALDFIASKDRDFGGAYFDQSVGDLLLVVQSTSRTTAGALASLKALIPADAVVRYDQVTFSEHDLQTARDAIASQFPNAIAFLAIDPRSNRVLAAVQPGAIAAVADAAGQLADAVTLVGDPGVVPSACTSRLACTVPWRGGTRLVGDGGCTWGFNARPTTTNTTKFVVTAGHCSRLNTNLKHNSSIVNTAGGVDENTFDKIGTQWTDALSAPLKTDSGDRNLIYISDSSKAYAITSIKTAAAQAVGDSVCMSGSYSNPGYKCGVIELEGITTTYARPIDGKYQTFTAMTRASMNSLGGDSGSPIISQTAPTAFGVLAARNTNGTKTYYGPIDLVMSDLSLRMCLNAACS